MMTDYKEWIMNKATTTVTVPDFKNNEMKYGYEDQEGYIDQEYGTQKLKRGRWYILNDQNAGEHGLWHQCEKEQWEMAGVEYSNYSEWADKDILPRWRCGSCNAQPPESIVTIWCLMEPDLTSTLVQNAIEEDDYDVDLGDPLEIHFQKLWKQGMLESL